MSSLNIKVFSKVLFTVGLFLLVVFALAFTPLITDLPTDKSGPFGDTVGGISAPFIGTMGVIVTFMAFWVQFEANAQLRKDIEKERFENKFYEMLRLQRENLKEIEVGEKFFGRQAILRIFEELRLLYFLTKDHLESWDKTAVGKIAAKPLDYHSKEITEIAYIFLFYGAENVMDKSKSLRFGYSSDFLVSCGTQIITLRNELRRHERINKSYTGTLFKITNYPNILTEQGSKLAHYFRHLFQAVTYVTTYKGLSLSEKERYSYLKILRAQLSNHEQSLLYFNAFHKQGKYWFSQGFFTKWKMIKNIPFYLHDFGVPPEEKLSEEIKKKEGIENEEVIQMRLTEILDGMIVDVI